VGFGGGEQTCCLFGAEAEASCDRSQLVLGAKLPFGRIRNPELEYSPGRNSTRKTARAWNFTEDLKQRNKKYEQQSIAFKRAYYRTEHFQPILKKSACA